MKNKIILIVFSWLLVIATMLIIYSFSNETGVESSKTSGGIIRAFLEIFLPHDKVTVELIAKFQYPVRKLAHFSIYALLGLTVSNAFYHSFKIKFIYKYLLSFALVVAYALSDEFHQGLVANRGPSFKDVLIDSCGGLFGIIAFLMMTYIIRKFKSRHKNY